MEWPFPHFLKSRGMVNTQKKDTLLRREMCLAIVGLCVCLPDQFLKKSFTASLGTICSSKT